MIATNLGVMMHFSTVFCSGMHDNSWRGYHITDVAIKPFGICGYSGVSYTHKKANLHVCESHRDASRTKCSRERHRERKAEEDKNQVGGSPSGSEVETRERRNSAENDSRIKHVWRWKRGEQTHCNLCIRFCF